MDHESLVKAVKSADIVISAVGPRQVGEQTRIIAAIKEAGNIKVSFKLFTVFFFCLYLYSFDVCKSLKSLLYRGLCHPSLALMWTACTLWIRRCHCTL